MPAGGEEHRDRQPRRPGRLDHHLQPGARRAPRPAPRPPPRPGSPPSAAPAGGTTSLPSPSSTRTVCVAGDAQIHSRPGDVSSDIALSSLPTRTDASGRPRRATRRSTATAPRTTSAGRASRSRHPLMCCKRARPRPGRPTSLIRDSVTGPAVAIRRNETPRRHDATPRAALDATHRTSRAAHATRDHQRDQHRRSLHEPSWGVSRAPGSAAELPEREPTPGADLPGGISTNAQFRPQKLVVPPPYREAMFPPDAFGVGVTVAELQSARRRRRRTAPGRRGAAVPPRRAPAGRADDAGAEGDAPPAHRAGGIRARRVQGRARGGARLRPARQRRPQRAPRSGRPRGNGRCSSSTRTSSEFFADELALVLNCSRAAATQLWERSTTLLHRLPATWAALADGWLDWPRARAIAAELGWPARESPDDVLAAIEAVVLPQATELVDHPVARSGEEGADQGRSGCGRSPPEARRARH